LFGSCLLESATMLFDELPAEIIEAILFFLPPRSLVRLSQTSKRLNIVANTPLLWRYHCRTQFRYWDPSHGFPESFNLPVNDVNWKDKFRERMLLERRVDHGMHVLVNTSRDRLEIIEHMLTISEEGTEYTYDVKDALLRHRHTIGEEEDHLARRFWATAVLEKLHRGVAIEEWQRCIIDGIGDGGTSAKRLESALAAFDLFVSDDKDDIENITSMLDRHAYDLRVEYPNIDELSVRDKALTVATFLRAHGHNGASDEDYHNLPNNFLGIALRDPEHHALPLIAVAIFCFVAQRVGLQAFPCSFPMHVYAMVVSPEGETLDGRPSRASESMYIDAFRDPIEVPKRHLEAQLRSMGASAFPDAFLNRALDSEIVVRSSRNIMHSVQTLQMHGNVPLADPDDSRLPLWYRQEPDFDKAFYASLWSTMLLQTHNSAGMSRRRHYLPFLCEYVQQHCPWDADLVEKYIAPMFMRYPERGDTLRILDLVREKDANEPIPKGRSPQVDKQVKYRIGQVFRHRRYGYEGVIVGWDAQCDATDAWIDHMGVDNLTGGRNQSFYHVLLVFPQFCLLCVR
jgi:F-box protein 21